MVESLARRCEGTKRHERPIAGRACRADAVAGSVAAQRMTQQISTPPDDPAEQVSALEALPAAVQRYLVFHAIMSAFGFPPEAIGHVVTGSELAASVEVEGRGFSYVLGPTVPHVASWLRRAVELWRAAEPAAREALFQGSPLFEHTRFPELIRTMTRAGLRPPIPIGLWYSRLESSGIGAAVRRLAAFSAATPSTNAAPRSRAAPTAPPSAIGPPRFPVGELAYMNDGCAQLSPAELARLVGRHASGDWGESLHGPDNETALQTGRAVMSAFRTTNGRLWLITGASRTRTVVWPQLGPDFPEEALLDLVCRYLGTGRVTDMRASPQEALFHLPLVGDFGPHHPHHPQEMETAALLLGAVITQDGEDVIPYRPEQFMRALWRAVDGLDLRPMDRKGRRFGHDAPDRAQADAKQWCKDQEIAAWYAASWEDRPA